MRWWWWWIWGIMWAQAALPLAAPAAARSPKPPVHTAASILIEAGGGRVLEERNADAPLPVGSLHQLMLLLLSIEQAQLGALPLEVPVTVGPVAVPARTPRKVAYAATPVVAARIPLHEDEAYLLSDLLKALVVTAADDAAVAVAEAIAGSVPSCLELMNARAQRLGMEATRYTSIGWVSTTTDTDMTTARSVARLAQALVRQPLLLQWSSLPGLPFHGGAVLLRNVNLLIGTVPGVDGLHVGSAADGRHAAVATAQRSGLRLIAVVLGAASSDERYRLAAELLERGFAQYERVDVVKRGDRINVTVRVLDGSVAQVTPVAGGTFSLLRKRGEEPRLEVYYQVPAALAAPVRRDQPIGELVVKESGEIVAVIPLLSSTNVISAGMLAAARR